MSAYIGEVSAAIRSRLFYPKSARARGAKGVVGVSFTIGPSGAVSSFAITRSSGDHDLDAAARSLVQGAGSPRLPAAPRISRRASTMSPTSSRLRALVLGSGAGGGVPQWNCGCRVCRLAWSGDRRVKPRTQAGLALTVDGANWLLLNASIDLRQQILATPTLHPKGDGRHSPIGAVVLTNAEVDSSAGLLALRERQPLVLFGTQATLDAIGANRMFDVVDRDVAPRRAVHLGEPFEPLPGIKLELFAIPGKVPLWLEEGNVSTDDIGEGTVCVAVEAAGKRLVYAPGLRPCYGGPQRSHRQCRCVVFRRHVVH